MKLEGLVWNIPGETGTKTKRYFLAALTSLLLVAGCIVGDELTTITIHPDGAVDRVTFRSNLHSTKTGRDGDRELADYKPPDVT